MNNIKEGSLLTYIGPEIRRRRKKKNWTLKNLADGICSLSYACKIETNMITPKYDIILKLIKRLKMDDNDIDLFRKMDENFSKLIMFVYYREHLEITKIVDEYRDLDHFKAHLFRFIEFAVISKSKNDKKAFTFSSYEKSMISYDMTILYLFKAIYYYHNYENKKAMDCLENINQGDLCIYSNALYLEYVAKLTFWSKAVVFYTFINDAISKSIELKNYNVSDDLELLYFLFLVIEKSHQLIKNKHCTVHLNNKYFLHYQMLYYYSMGDFAKCIHLNDCNSQLLAYVKMCSYEKSGQIKELKQYINNGIYEMNNLILTHRIETLKYKYEDTEKYYEYSSKVALPFAQQQFLVGEIKFYRDIVVEKEKNQFHYKECLRINEDCKEYIKNASKISNNLVIKK